MEDYNTTVFILYYKDIEEFKIDENETFLFLEIFDEILKYRKGKRSPNKKIFIYLKSENLKISNSKLFEYNLMPERELIEFYNEVGIKTPREKLDMFNNYKITAVTFGEINDVALETAVEKIAAQLDGVELKTKNEKTYLVKNGKAIELNGSEFKTMVEKYVKGKTVDGLRRNKEMFTLIQNLGIINEVTLTNVNDDLSSIFG